MATILHIKSSSNVQSAFSRQIGAIVAERLKVQNPGARIVERDLVTNPVPHIDPEFLGAMSSGDDTAVRKEACACRKCN